MLAGKPAQLKGDEPHPLKVRRVRLGLTQAAVANATEASITSVWRWENFATPEPWRRPLLAAALRMTPQELDELIFQGGGVLDRWGRRR